MAMNTSGKYIQRNFNMKKLLLITLCILAFSVTACAESYGRLWVPQDPDSSTDTWYILDATDKDTSVAIDVSKYDLSDIGIHYYCIADSADSAVCQLVIQTSNQNASAASDSALAWTRADSLSVTGAKTLMKEWKPTGLSHANYMRIIVEGATATATVSTAYFEVYFKKKR